MNHFAHIDLIRVHQSEMRAAADHHRLVHAARRAARPARPRIASAPLMIRRAVVRQVRVLRASGP